LKKINILALLYFCTAIVQAQTLDTLQNYTGDEVVFVGKKIYNQQAVSLTNIEFKKLAASFDDPARLLLKYPGFSSDNDQANGIVYHGLPSHTNSWQLNGLEIVNPNHLSNAGTFTDVSSISAGGVNMFSGNIIDKFTFHSPFDINKKSNVVGGSANVQVDHLKRSYAQLSLLGLEAGIAMNTSSKHQLYGNFRYSFTGVLADMGVDFGGEKIRFADAVLGYQYKGIKSTTNFIFTKGKSRNFHAKQDSVLLLKDVLEIDYNSDINIAQVTHENKMEKGILRLGASYSYKEDTRMSNGNIITPIEVVIDQKFLFQNQILTLHQEYKTQKNYKFGIKEINTVSKVNVIDAKAWTFLPYVEKKFSLSSVFNLDTKVEAFLQNKNTINPFLKLTYFDNKNTTVSMTANKSAQQLSLVQYQDSDLAQSYNFSIDAKQDFSELSLQANIFYHTINKIGRGSSFYTLFNTFDIDQAITTFDAKAISKGLGLYIDYYPTSSFWLNANTTFFDTKYLLDNKMYNSENNVGYSGNINLGKDWKKGNKKWSISTSYHFRGGQYVFGVLKNYQNTRDYSTQPLTRLAPYSRLDFRVNFSKEKYLISLDIQNFTSKINEAYISYDLDGLSRRGQLGLLPVISYKRFF
jgi:hypothetical protein